MVRNLIRNQLRNPTSSGNSCDLVQPATHVLPNICDSSLKAVVETWDSLSELTKQTILKLIRLDLLDRNETELLP